MVRIMGTKYDLWSYDLNGDRSKKSHDLLFLIRLFPWSHDLDFVFWWSSSQNPNSNDLRTGTLLDQMIWRFKFLMIRWSSCTCDLAFMRLCSCVQIIVKLIFDISIFAWAFAASLRLKTYLYAFFWV